MNTAEDAKEHQNKDDVVKNLLKERGIIYEPKDALAAVDYLSKRLQTSERQIYKERFLFLMAGIIVFNGALFAFTGSGWWGPVCITVLEIIVLLYIGELYDIKEIKFAVGKFLSILNATMEASQKIKKQIKKYFKDDKNE